MSEYSEEVRAIRARAANLGFWLVPYTDQAKAEDKALQAGYASSAHQQRDKWGDHGRIVQHLPEPPK